MVEPSRPMEARHNPRRPSGYTLVEMVLVVTILSIVGGVSSFVVLQAMKAYARHVPAMHNAYQARSSLERMRREIRALEDTSSITTMTATSLTFTGTGGTSIAYAYTGGNLDRNGDRLAKGLTAFSFTYWKSNGTTASAATDVHLIEIDLTVDSLGQTYRLQTAVFPRICGHG
jgi:prepilin-type N-terminal cleavage/methylation domain-containing protein